MPPYLVICSISSSNIPLDFHESIRVVPVKYLMHVSAGRNTKQFWNIPEDKYFSPLRTFSLFIKSLVNPFVDIALPSFDSSFNHLYLQF